MLHIRHAACDISFIFVMLLAVILTGQSAAAASSTTLPATRPAPPAFPAEGAGSILKIEDGRVWVNFNNATIQLILSELSGASGRAILVNTGSLEGRITIKTQAPMSVDDAVALIRLALFEKQLGLSLNGTFFVVSPSYGSFQRSDNGPHFVEVVHLRFAKAQQVGDQIKAAQHSDVNFFIDPDANTITILDTISYTRRMVQFIQDLDKDPG